MQVTHIYVNIYCNTQRRFAIVRIDGESDCKSGKMRCKNQINKIIKEIHKSNGYYTDIRFTEYRIEMIAETWILGFYVFSGFLWISNATIYT